MQYEAKVLEHGKQATCVTVSGYIIIRSPYTPYSIHLRVTIGFGVGRWCCDSLLASPVGVHGDYEDCGDPLGGPPTL